MSLVVRSAGADDFTAYAGPPPPAEWCSGEVQGCVAERDGRMVAIAVATEDREGRFWLWVNVRETVPAIVLHRHGLRLLRSLRDSGHTMIHAFCDPRLPTAERWLRRVGFRPGPLWPHPTGEKRTVWKCDLST
jgi:hypothetical protein